MPHGLTAEDFHAASLNGARNSSTPCRICAKQTTPVPVFAITGYTLHQNLGGDVAQAMMRERLRQRGRGRVEE